MQGRVILRVWRCGFKTRCNISSRKRLGSRASNKAASDERTKWRWHECRRRNAVGLFKKKYPARHEIKGDGPWAVLQGEHEGRIMLIRSNEGLRSCVGHPDY